MQKVSEVLKNHIIDSRQIVIGNIIERLYICAISLNTLKCKKPMVYAGSIINTQMIQLRKILLEIAETEISLGVSKLKNIVGHFPFLQRTIKEDMKNYVKKILHCRRD